MSALLSRQFLEIFPIHITTRTFRLSEGEKSADGSALHVAAIALSFWNFRFRPAPTIGGQRAADIYLLLKLPRPIPSRVAPIAGVGFNHRPLTRARSFLLSRPEPRMYELR
jgi:hypothetical protein